jgi:hypothetical protein
MIENRLNSNHIERNVVAAKLSSESSVRLGYSSLFLSSALSMPYVMETFGISPEWYLPFTAVALSYLKSEKNRKDHKSAIQVVSDFQVEILQFMMRLPIFSDAEIFYP